MDAIVTRKGEVVEDPSFVRWLLSSPKAGWLWLLPRLWLGYAWFNAGSHKISNPAWVDGGQALKGFWTGAVVVPAEGRPAIAFDWYRTFIQSLLDAEAYTWFGPLVAYGELIVGIALIIGAFTGIAAFLGAFMNFNFIMAGSASTNPVLFLIAIGLILAWKIAGYIGADYFLLPWIGTPWRAKDKEKVSSGQPAMAGD